MTTEKIELIDTLKQRFEYNMNRHTTVKWDDVEAIIKANQTLQQTLLKMEESGGEPDVTYLDGNLVYVDFSKETPKRRSICYDRQALDARKNNKPETSAMDLAKEYGIQMLDETQYRALQEIEPLDLKTSTWVLTPERIRLLGGALFCDRRYDTVFTYHNGADSYYGSRSFRGFVTLK